VTATTTNRSPLARVPGVGDQTVVVLPGHDQVPGRGPGTSREQHRAAVLDQAKVDQVVADDPAQLAAVLPGVGHQQHVLTGEPGGDVGAPGVLEHLLMGAAGDPAVLVTGLQRPCRPRAAAGWPAAPTPR
jgi:hypothetical protein